MGIEPGIRTLMEYNDVSDEYGYDWDVDTDVILNPYGPTNLDW